MALSLCEETILKFKSIQQYEHLILHLLEVTSSLWVIFIPYVSIHVHFAALSLLHYICFLKLCLQTHKFAVIIVCTHCKVWGVYADIQYMH